jgi:hypothetical protein
LKNQSTVTLGMFSPPFPYAEELVSWFPPPEYAIAIPATLLVFGLTVISIFISCVFISEARSKKSQ